MFDTLKTIVIGTSLSEASDDIVRAGVDIARSTGATPLLVHVHSRPASPAELFGAVDGAWLEESTKALRDGLTQQAARTGLSGLPGFTPGQLRLTMGSSAPAEIVALARQAKAGLIVVGAAEGGTLRRILLGSTAEGVIHHAPCPVFVVPLGAAKEKDEVVMAGAKNAAEETPVLAGRH